MRNQRLTAARKVAASLFDAEKDIDAAVASTAGLIVTIVNARKEANLPAVIGQAALNNLGSAVHSLLQTRHEIVEAHQGLAVARDQIGLTTFAWGDEFPKPPVSGENDAPATLRAVA